MPEYDRQERTERLERTFNSIESLQQTGVLKVERAKGGVRETAVIVFLYGQIVEAVVGMRVGQDALDWVNTWGSCRYTFDIKLPSDITVPPSSPEIFDEPVVANSPLAIISQIVQKYTHPALDVVQITNEAVSEKSIDTASTGPMPVSGVAFPSASPRTPIPQTMMPQSEAKRPRAPFRLFDGSEAVGYMEQFGLSRLHRHVFFLLDGQRTAVDVVRLTGRSFYEIQRLLADLEQLGLIRIEQVPIREVLNGF